MKLSVYLFHYSLMLVRKLIPLVLILLFTNGYSELKDDEWGTEELFDDIVVVSVNGKITHGDRYRLFFHHTSTEKCNLPQSYISFYSVAGNAKEKFEDLPSKSILTEINQSQKFLTQVVDISDFIAGMRALLYVGINSVEQLIEHHKDNDEIKIELLAFYDQEDERILPVDIEEYFDIPRNTWSLNGFEEAVGAGKAECLSRVSSSNKEIKF